MPLRIQRPAEDARGAEGGGRMLPRRMPHRVREGTRHRPPVPAVDGADGVEEEEGAVVENRAKPRSGTMMQQQR